MKTQFFKTFVDLLKDKSVPFGYKLLPLAGLAYLLWPFDIASDLVPFFGQIDDAAIVATLVGIFMNVARKKAAPKQEGTTSVKLVAHGAVQGVVFRGAAKKEAERLGITGTVKNDGNVVEAVAYGKKEDLEVFKDWFARGPEQAVVERLEEEWNDKTDGRSPDLATFDILR